MEMTEYRSVLGSAENTIIIKKSRFITHIHHVESVEEAEKILEETRSRYWDASHNCYAYSIDRINPLLKSSDDGEPKGTAGMPMLDVLIKTGITDILAIVTRYFGGTLLGANGLVRAYSQSVKEALDHAQKVIFTPMEIFCLEIPFTLLGKLQYCFEKMPVFIEKTEYGTQAVMTVSCAKKYSDTFIKEAVSLTFGKVSPQLIGESYKPVPEDKQS